ncbi:MAG: thioesterase family protein [Cyanobacteria bacterium]|nr:thioesterase family protein [Cyanobacteriota bacterium]MDA0867506.1 thioesterase family protein [Cyanobacteriota bacterium]
MVFIYHRTIRFKDTDAAGVVYFANVLSICHEAYEASLADVGVELETFFGKGELAVPIIHADIDFRQPLKCGDDITVHLTAQAIDEHRFSTHYRVMASTDRPAATAQTDHICITARDRRRSPLPPQLQQWLRHHGEAAAVPNPEAGDG